MKGVRFNVISVTRGWVGVQFPGRKRYVTLNGHFPHINATTFSMTNNTRCLTVLSPATIPETRPGTNSPRQKALW